MRFGLLADDLTGACDSSVPFLDAGRVIVSLWPCVPAEAAACLAISTESRAEAPEVAFARSRDAATALREAGVEVLYRKVDSQLRGNPAAEIAM